MLTSPLARFCSREYRELQLAGRPRTHVLSQTLCEKVASHRNEACSEVPNGLFLNLIALLGYHRNMSFLIFFEIV